jgi:hypothetical protein
MSNHEPQEAGSATEPPLVEEVNTGPDWLLVMLVALVNAEKSAEVGLVLHVSGVVVSGVLVSEMSFGEHVRDWLTQIGGPEVGERITRIVALLSSLPKAESPEVAELGDAPSALEFIHLRDARVFTSGSDRPLPGMLWRGRLSHVSAWSYGVMELHAD